MAKGLAVVYGRDTVVFKALEDGNIVLGNTAGGKPGIVTIDGSLKLDIDGKGVNSFLMDVDGSGSAQWAVVSASMVSTAAGSNVQDELDVLRSDLGIIEGEILAVSQELSTEKLDRAAADVILQSNIDAEAAARIAGDATLQANIDSLQAEFDALVGGELGDTLSTIVDLQEFLDGDGSSATQLVRGIGDLTDYTVDLSSALSTQIAQLSNGAGGNIEAVSVALVQEISDREAADLTLQSNLDAEEAARLAEDLELSYAIDTEAAARASADATLQANIDAEAAARIAEDLELSYAIDANKQAGVVDVQGTANEIVVESTSQDANGKVITLGLPDNVTIASQLDVGGQAIVVGNLTTQSDLYVEGNTNLGNSDANTLGADLDAVVVNGTFQAPKLTRDQAEAKYITNAGSEDFSGHMFYLTSDDAANDTDAFPEGKKWYFCENGVWHASFFYVQTP